MKKRTIITLLLAVLLLGWMALIFSLSCEDGTKSGKTSTSIATEISEIITPSKPVEETEKIIQENQKIIRKSGHVLLYMVLGVLATSLAVSALNVSKRNRFLLSWSFCVFYAATDELHQFFVTGRSGMIEDICLDSIGVLVSVVLVLATVELYKKLGLKRFIFLKKS